VDISHAVVEAILSMRSDAIIAADREGIIHFWNSSAGRLFGYSPDEAISRSLDFIIPERLRQRHWDGYRRVMETGKSRYGEGDVLHWHCGLLRPRRQRPCCRCRATKRANEFSPAHVDCHVTPPEGGHAHAIACTISRFIPQCTVNDCSGSKCEELALSISCPPYPR
jgi:PAS domain-containing protein